MLSTNTLCHHPLPSPPAREPANHREGKSIAGETSPVREPMAGETSKSGELRFPFRLVIIANENDVQKRERATNHASQQEGFLEYTA
jgi:hypothetical protein